MSMERQIRLLAHTLTDLFLVFTGRRSTAVSVTGFRMCPPIYLGGLETSNSSHLYHRQDFLLLLPHKAESIQSLQCTARFSALLPHLELLSVLSKAMKYKQHFMIAQKFFSRKILHNKPTYFSHAAPF